MDQNPPLPKSRVRFGLGLVLAVALVAACTTTPPPSIETPEQIAARAKLDQAWETLWGNDAAKALADFQEVRKTLPASADTYRGEGLADFALGDVFNAAAAFAKAIELDPLGPEAPVIRDFVDQFIPWKRDVVETFARLDAKMTATYPGTPIARAGLRQRFKTSLESDLDVKAAAVFSATLGMTSGWEICGPVSDPSGTAFDTPLLAEEATDGNYGALEIQPGLASRTWQALSTQDPAGVVNLGERLSSGEAGIAYAKTSIILDKAGAYSFTVDHSGACKIWVDGELVFTNRDYAGGNEQGWVSTNLVAGVHQILVKIAERNTRSWFRLWCFSSPERIGIPSPAFALQACSALDGAPEGTADPILALFASRLQNHGRGEDSFWLSWLLEQRGILDGLEREMYGVEPSRAGSLAVVGKIPPTSAWRLWLESSLHELRGRDDVARNTLAPLVRNNVSFAPAWDRLVNEALEDGRTTEVKRLVGLSNFGGEHHFSNEIALYTNLLGAKDQIGADAALDSIDKRWPGTSWVPLTRALSSHSVNVLTNLSKELSAMGLKTGAARLALSSAERSGDDTQIYNAASDLLAVTPNDADLQREVADSGFSSGKVTLQAHVDTLKRLMLEYPGAFDVVSWARSRADGLWQQLNDYANSVNTSQRSVDVYNLLQSLASTRRNAGTEELSIQPSNFSLRTKLRQWKSQKDLGNPEVIGDPFYAVDTDRTTPREASSDAYLLSDLRKEWYFEDGGFHGVHTVVLRIDSVAGVHAESTQQIDGRGIASNYRLSLAWTIKPDGSRVRGVDGNWSVSFPGLAPGDYIVLSYVLDGARSGALSPYLWTTFHADGLYPSAHRSLELVYPNTKGLVRAKHNIDASKVMYYDTKVDEDLTSFRVEAVDEPGHPWSSNSHTWRDSYQWIDFSTVPSWSVINTWYAGLSAGRAVPTPYIQALADRIAGTIQDPAQIADALFRYAAQDVAYEDLNFEYSPFVPQWAETVSALGYGDCKDKSTLFIALLAAKGIKADIALSAPDYAGPNLYLPSPRFSHAVVVTGEGDHVRVWDPTSDLLNASDLPAVLDGTAYLRVDSPQGGGSEASTELSRVASPETGHSLIVLRMKHAADHWEVSGTFTLRGTLAALLRERGGTKDSGALQKSLAGWVAGFVPGFVLKDYQLSGVDDLSTNPVLEVHGTSPLIVGANDGGVALTPVWLDGSLWSLPSRIAASSSKETFELRYPELAGTLDQTWIWDLPAGFQAELPSPKKLDLGGSTMTLRWYQDGSTVSAARSAQILQSILTPGWDGQLSAFVAGVISADGESALARRTK